ncbi:MAG: class A beta-lactamase-related serine hydrolase [Acidobacteria bacterium]|nr:class A beta-lactamase-related serine hydrolase [Acidobacteriota bacterium]
MPSQPFRRIACCLFVLWCVLCVFPPGHVAGQTGVREAEVKRKLRELIAASGAETVAVAFHDLETGWEVMLDEGASFHAASTMKVPVMLELFRQARAGRLSLDARVSVRNDFKSIADGSSFSVASADDAEPSLYKQIGGSETVRRLLHLMITESSNLATNILIELVTPQRVMETMRGLGAKDIRVLRGVEDGKAFARGLNNTTTARDLHLILKAIAARRAVSKKASDEMVRVLLAQKFNEGLPAGLPAAARVAHKTGSITKINHDAGIIYVPGRRKPYVLVVLTRGLAEEKRAHRLIADISKAIYEGMIK